jgi:hypothetical protein
MGEKHRSGSAERHGRGRVKATAVAGAGAFLVLGTAPLAVAPTAHADLEDLFTPIADAVSLAATAVDPNLAGDLATGVDLDSVLAPALAAVDPFGSLDGLLGNWFQTLVFDPIHELGQLWVASPFGQLLDPLFNWSGIATPAAGTDTSAWSWLFGDTGAGGTAAAAASANPAASAAALETASVPLRMQAITEPVVDISVNGGPSVPVLVDTGSAGLVLPIWEMGLNQLAFPTGWGMGAYSGGLAYVYLTMPATVNFGSDIATGTDVVTQQTSIDAVIFAYPTSWDALINTGGTWNSFFAPAGVDGVLGIGPNAVGPTPDSIVTAALPGSLGQGVLIDQANGVLQFGPNPLGSTATAVAGAPNALLAVSINGGPLQYNVPSIIDSGGVYGTMPSSLLGSTGGTIPAGTQVAVYSNDGHTLLYSYRVSNYAPTVISSGSMNTGNYPFAQQPVYISNAGRGTTIFGGVS